MPEEKPSSATERHQLLFLSLVMTYQNLAWQGLGKIADPQSGEVKRDLESARFAIDMLDMLKMKCQGNLSGEEERLLNQTLADLKLNYVEEATRQPESSSLTAESQSTSGGRD